MKNKTMMIDYYEFTMAKTYFDNGYKDRKACFDLFFRTNPFGGGYARQEQPQGDSYQQAAYRYIQYRRYQEALNALQSSQNKDGRWYYLSALAHHGLGNQVTAMEHIRRAVSMEPDNDEYLRTLSYMENGGQAYRQQAGNFRGFTWGGSSVASLCLCYLFQLFCCRGRFFCC